MCSILLSNFLLLIYLINFGQGPLCGVHYAHLEAINAEATNITNSFCFNKIISSNDICYRQYFDDDVDSSFFPHLASLTFIHLATFYRKK